jgi:hypothetical protein
VLVTSKSVSLGLCFEPLPRRMYDSTNYPNLGKNLGVCDSLSLFLYFHASYLLKSIPTWYEQVRTLKVLQAPKGGNVLAHESICSLYLKYILEIF